MLSNRKRGTDNRLIKVIYPKTLGQAYPQLLAMCELFIEGLLNTTEKQVYCKVNSNLGYVESNDIDIKHSLTLILKTKQLEAFYLQFKRLLKKVDFSEKCLGKLELIDKKNKLYFYIEENENFPNFNWRITKEMK